MADMRPQRNIPETSLRDFYNTLFRHKRKILIFFFSVVSIVAFVALFGSETYKSEAELLVRLGRESVTLDPTAATGQVVSVLQERENEINSECEILKSRELAGKVVDAVGINLVMEGAEETLSPDDSLLRTVRYYVRQALKFPFTAIANLFPLKEASNPGFELQKRELAVESLMKDLKIESMKKSNVISISYGANSPWLAQRILNTLVGLYLEKHIDVHRTGGSFQFFNEQKEALRSSLAQTEEELKNLKNSTGTGSIPDQRSILLQRIGAIKSELAEAESAAASSEAKVKTLNASIAKLPTTLQTDEKTGFPSSAADGMRKNVYDLQMKEQELLSTYTPDSIPVQEIRRQIEEGRALLAKAEQQKQVTMAINENRQKMELDLLIEGSNLSSLQARAQALKTQLDRAKGELSSLNDTEMRLAQPERDLETQRANYRKYSESLEQARIDQALEMEKISNISIVQPSSYPGKPAGLRKLVKIAIGFFLGIFGGLGLAVFFEFQDHSLRKPEDVNSRLNLPVLATLRDASGERQKEKVRRQKGEARGGYLGSESGAGHEDAGNRKPYEMLLGANGNRKALGHLVRLFEPASDVTGGVIAFASCHPGEGVSTTAELLAKQIAQQSSGRVLIVDANSNSPSLHFRFGVKLSPGLAEFGSNGRSALSSIQATTVQNLDILSGGAGSQELSANALKAFAEALPALRQEYSHIICDLPPLLEHGCAARLASVMDGVVLVVEAEKTKWEVASSAKEELLQANWKILGVVLNKRRLHIPDWLYKKL